MAWWWALLNVMRIEGLAGTGGHSRRRGIIDLNTTFDAGVLNCARASGSRGSKTCEMECVLARVTPSVAMPVDLALGLLIMGLAACSNFA
jgi:hypothetical protein